MSKALAETVIELRPGIELCCPASPLVCSYVRIEVQGNEVRYWGQEVLRSVPSVALASLLGDIREYCPPLLAAEKNAPLYEAVGHLRSGVQIKSPTPPSVCEYIQVEVNGEEVGYWDYAELQDDPCSVIGAFLGLLRKHCPPLAAADNADIDTGMQPADAP